MAGAEPLPVRVVSRRAFTRAAIFGAGAVLAACGSEPERARREVGGGGLGAGGEDEHVETEQGDTHGPTWTRDQTPASGADATEAAVEEPIPAPRGCDVPGACPERVSPVEVDPRQCPGGSRCRHLPPCVARGTCPAPPYGAPPADLIA